MHIKSKGWGNNAVAPTLFLLIAFLLPFPTLPFAQSIRHAFKRTIVSVRPAMADFGSDQGRSEFETTGAGCFVEDFK